MLLFYTIKNEHNQSRKFLMLYFFVTIYGLIYSLIIYNINETITSHINFHVIIFCDDK